MGSGPVEAADAVGLANAFNCADEPENSDSSTEPRIPGVAPLAVYCQNVHDFQPPGSGVLGPPLR